MNSLANKIRLAIDSEFPGAKPAASVWQRVASTLPVPAAGRRRTASRYLPVALAGTLVLSLASVALANTPQGRSAIDWAFGQFGIHLVVNTPEPQPDPVGKSPYETSGVDVPWQGMAKLQAMVPTGMRLPTYMPEGFEDPAVNLNTWRAGVSVSFLARHTNQSVSVEYHSSAFGRGSMTATAGEAQDIQEIKINDKSALAYRDDAGWAVTWALYGHQYTVQTNISLDEAEKIAASIR